MPQYYCDVASSGHRPRERGTTKENVSRRKRSREKFSLFSLIIRSGTSLLFKSNISTPPV
ncbi:Uncharacterized protein APZ42_017250 [Daphnia magna]|uniref:Uncharacterized protein n=1 Tax=Daphnia magna TaxID=35525 RepID=A0A164ZQC8_9CRUS|nr:Uncharacterized protein APZ42_017250 [Daphnia magna]